LIGWAILFAIRRSGAHRLDDTSAEFAVGCERLGRQLPVSADRKEILPEGRVCL
jgi:hypothetical protein